MQFMRYLVAATLVFGLGYGVSTADDKKPDEGKREEAQAATEPAIGKAAPDFTLKNHDGKEFALSKLKDKVIVLEWFNYDCPVCKQYNEAMKGLAKKYAEKGVIWLAVDSTHFRTAEQNAKYARDKEIKYPILSDFDGKVGRAYKASATPHMFVINKGVLVYNGAIEKRGSSTNYVADALDAVLANKDVSVSKTAPFGCSVKYKR